MYTLYCVNLNLLEKIEIIRGALKMELIIKLIATNYLFIVNGNESKKLKFRQIFTND